MEDPPCFTKLLPGSAGHPHAILNSGISGKGNSLLEKGSWKHGLGFIITVWLPILANPDVRATQPGEKSPLLWPHCCAVPLFPHLQNSSFDRLCLCSPVHAHEGQWAGVMVTQGHHKHSAFLRKAFFLLTALPTNSLIKDLFVGQELANVEAWLQPWLYRAPVQLISHQFTAIGK